MSYPVTGVIEGVIARPTRVGDMYDVVVNGTKYGHGKYAPRGFKQGDMVTFEVDERQNGQYTNRDIKRGSMRPATDAAVMAAAPSAPAPTRVVGEAYSNGAPIRAKYEPFDERQQIISTQAAVNTALTFCTLAASQGAVPGAASAKAADKLSLMRQWVLDEAQRFYKLATNRDLDLPVTEELVEGTVTKTRAPAKPKPAAEPDVAEDTGYDEYPVE